MIEILKYSVLATVLVSFDASKTVNAFAPGKWGFTTSEIVPGEDADHNFEIKSPNPSSRGQTIETIDHSLESL